MNIWEQKRKEREQQKEQLFGQGVQQFGAPPQQGPIIIQGGGQQPNPSALGISAMQKSAISAQSASVLQNNGIMPPPAQQPQAAPEPPAPRPQEAQRAPDAGAPANARDRQYDKYESGSKPMEFTSYQPRPQQIVGGDPELFASPQKKKPSEMTDREYEEYEKRQIRQQQTRLIRAVVWNPKASNFDKREVEELLKVDAVFKQMYERERAAKDEQDRQLEAQREEARRLDEEREAQKRLQERPPQPQPGGYPQQPAPPAQGPGGHGAAPYEPQYGGGAAGLPQQPYMDPQFQQYGPPQGGACAQLGQYGQQYQPRPYYQNANAPSERELFQLQEEVKFLREKLRCAELDQQNYEKQINELKYQLNVEKQQRLQTERALVDAQRDMERYTAEISNFQHSLKEGRNYVPNLPQMPAGGYLGKYQSYGQQGGYGGPQARPSGVQSRQGYANVQQQLPQQQFSQPDSAGQIVQNILNGQDTSYNKPPSRSDSRQPPQVLSPIQQPDAPYNPVDSILNKANRILDAYPTSDQTIARAAGSQFDQVRQQYRQIQSADSAQGDNMRTIQADSSIIEQGTIQQRRQNEELNKLLNQEDNYNTIAMERPPDDIPPSLLQSIEPLRERLPSAKYQPSDIARKYGQSK